MGLLGKHATYQTKTQLRDPTNLQQWTKPEYPTNTKQIDENLTITLPTITIPTNTIGPHEKVYLRSTQARSAIHRLWNGPMVRHLSPLWLAYNVQWGPMGSNLHPLVGKMEPTYEIVRTTCRCPKIKILIYKCLEYGKSVLPKGPCIVQYSCPCTFIKTGRRTNSKLHISMFVWTSGSVESQDSFLISPNMLFQCRSSAPQRKVSMDEQLCTIGLFSRTKSTNYKWFHTQALDGSRMAGIWLIFHKLDIVVNSKHPWTPWALHHVGQPMPCDDDHK